MLITPRLRYALYGVLASASLISLSVSAGPNDGVFGDYFTRMTGYCDISGTNSEVLTGLAATSDGFDFGTKRCTSLRVLIGRVFGLSLAPIGQAIIGFDAITGNPKYGSVNWQNSGGNISYTGGNVGIGTTSPAAKIHISGNGGESIRIQGNQTTGNNWIGFNNNGTNLGYLGYGSVGNNGLNLINYQNDKLSLGTNNIEMMYILPSGNVGIGTATPGAKLEVAGGGFSMKGGEIIIQRPVTTGGWARGLHYTPNNSYDSTNAGLAGIGLLGGGTTESSIYLTFGAAPWSSTRGIQIKSDGNVGIGTSTPVTKLAVVGDIAATGWVGAGCETNCETGGGYALMYANGTTVQTSTATIYGGINDAAGARMDAGGGWLRTYGQTGWYNGTYCGGFHMTDSSWIRSYCGKYLYVDSIIQAGAYMNSPAYYYISDARLKKDLVKISSPLDKITQMNGYYFKWKKDNKKDLGLIAQEVEKIFPDAVGEYTDPDSKKTYKNVEYGHLVAPIIEAIKELANERTSQASEIQDLKIELNELKVTVQKLTQNHK